MGDLISVKDLTDLHCRFQKAASKSKKNIHFFLFENQDVTHFHELNNAMMLSLIIYIMNW